MNRLLRIRAVLGATLGATLALPACVPAHGPYHGGGHGYSAPRHSYGQAPQYWGGGWGGRHFIRRLCDPDAWFPGVG